MIELEYKLNIGTLKAVKVCHKNLPGKIFLIGEMFI